MNVSLSMRAAWQQVADRHDASPSWVREMGRCACCGDPYPCPDRVMALAQINALNEAVEMRRIGRAFYDDTDEGQRVLVIPITNGGDA